MSRSVTCYPIPGKPKARLLCEAFAAGVRAAGGTAHVCIEPPRELEDGAAVFYGVRPAVAHLWEQAKREGRDWYYIDNSYFDVARERQFRVTKNAIQHTGRGESDGKRFARLGVKVCSIRPAGEFALIAAQSQEFMRLVAGDPGWLGRTEQRLRAIYGPLVGVRSKGEKRPLAEDLARAFVVATWSSAVAIEARLAGVPAVICSPVCAAYDVDERRAWASVLADNQWTVDELARGDAWKALNA